MRAAPTCVGKCSFLLLLAVVLLVESGRRGVADTSISAQAFFFGSSPPPFVFPEISAAFVSLSFFLSNIFRLLVFLCVSSKKEKKISEVTIVSLDGVAVVAGVLLSPSPLISSRVRVCVCVVRRFIIFLCSSFSCLFFFSTGVLAARCAVAVTSLHPRSHSLSLALALCRTRRVPSSAPCRINTPSALLGFLFYREAMRV